MLKRKIVILILLILSTLLYFFSKNTNPKKQIVVYEKLPSIKFPTEKLNDGDIILRRGYGVDSTIALNFSEGEKRYSHAGIIRKKEDNIFVDHIIDDKEKGIDGIFEEPLANFLNGVSIWAIYRFPFSSEDKKDLINYIDKLKIKNIHFDIDFNLYDDAKMYCSEFVYKVINNSTPYKIKAEKIFAGERYVTISDLYENNNAYLIQRSHRKLNEREKIR
ncbi:MAG: hypothetical protein KU29_08865 [Sulfurovum sp. FS06-10]|jgi:hypothetical protein|nr:MAG: hypothetical protein KU29_08865 [Sulfurovum sp. FS06-10]